MKGPQLFQINGQYHCSYLLIISSELQLFYMEHGQKGPCVDPLKQTNIPHI